jgi:hypothetical protein
VPRKSIREQCANYQNAPENVDVVLLNGGINDVGLTTILNPLAIIPSLDSVVKRACLQRMGDLLDAVRIKFSKPSCHILVLGYYAILSPKSDHLGIRKLLSLHGIAIPSYGIQDADFVGPVVQRCEEFFRASTKYLIDAVAQTRDPRIQFVPSGFKDENAVFAGHSSMLWGINLDPTLSPQDPIAEARHPLCDKAFRGASHLLDRETCYRASAGHPNVRGALQLCNQVMLVLSQSPKALV